LDYLRLKARLKSRIFGIDISGMAPRLHFGCGGRVVRGWTNVDIINSPLDLDLLARLPFPKQSFEAIVGQQVIEHFDLWTELLPLLEELHRVAKAECEIWLSTPDMEKICRGYLEDNGLALKLDRLTRHKDHELQDPVPCQHVINVLFHQGGEHRNLFDFELLAWALERAGFHNCLKAGEEEFRNRFPEFGPRGDDPHGFYVRALA
jgi:predicted SAM-dependent methyltransferase